MFWISSYSIVILFLFRFCYVFFQIEKKLWVSFLFFYNCEPSFHDGFPSYFVFSTHNSNYLCILFWLFAWIQTSRNVIPKERWWLPLKQKGIIRVNMFFILRGHSFSFCIMIIFFFFCIFLYYVWWQMYLSCFLYGIIFVLSILSKMCRASSY